MYNPFPLLIQRLLEDQLAKGKCYFVRQTYSRGMEAGLRGAFLFRSYEEGEEEGVERHLAALSGDPNVFLYDARLQEQLHRLRVAASQPAGYRIYYAAKKGVDWKPPAPLESAAKSYIRIYHPSWRTKKGGDRIQVGLLEEFGQLLLKFSYGREEDTVPLETVEGLIGS